jgi:hypothetical protein
LLNESNESQPAHRLSSFESKDKGRLQAGADERTLASSRASINLPRFSSWYHQGM